jgi:hypothetical protein
MMDNPTIEDRLAALAQIRKEFENAIAAARACELDDQILAWDNGMCVVLFEGRANAGSVVNATPVSLHEGRRLGPTIRNGNGERPRVRSRREVLAAHIADAEKHLASFVEAEWTLDCERAKSMSQEELHNLIEKWGERGGFFLGYVC